MVTTLKYTVPFISISLLFSSIAFAQDASVQIESEADVRAQNPLVRPLDAIRARLQGNTDAQVRTQVLPTAAPIQQRDQMRIDANASTQERANANDRSRLGVLVRQHGGLIKERFTLAIRQFENLVARIESRLEKMKAQGIATAEVEADLEIAKSDIATAKADIRAVTTFLVSVTDESDRTTVRTELQRLVTQARTSIREAHASLQTVIRGLVALSQEARASASTSVDIETDAEVSTQ